MSKLFNFLVLIYIIFIAIHLYCCHFRVIEIRKITKVFLMPLLSTLYYLGTPEAQFSKNVLAGIFFGFLGDVLILVDDPFSSLIVPGVICFFIGHLLYMVSFLRETGYYNYKKYFFVLLIISSIFCYIGTIAFKYLKEGFARGNVMIPGISYLSLLMLLNIAACFYTFTYFNKYSLLASIGSLVFFISDFILVRKMFYEENKYYQVILTATYILAQSLISYGLSHRRSKYIHKEKEV